MHRRLRTHTLAATLIAIVIVAGLTASVIAQQRRARTAQEVAQQALPAVVVVAAFDDNQEVSSLGSGFFLSPSLIATNHHVIDGAAEVFVKLINRGADDILEARVVSVDRTNDLALLAVPRTSVRPLDLEQRQRPAVGDTVFVIGNPKGLPGTMSQGIISAIRRKAGLVQIDAAISPGSSGGPVLNVHGRVIGVAAMLIEDGQNLNFAIPVEFLETLIAEGGDEVEEEEVGARATPVRPSGSGSEPARPPASAPTPKAPPVPTRTATELSTDADAKFRSGDFKGAVDGYAAAIALDPRATHPHLWRAEAYVRLGKYTDAESGFRTVSELEPANTDAFVRLGVSLLLQKKYNDAADAYRRALIVDAKAADAHHGLALALRGLQRYDDGLKAIAEAISLKPADAEFQYAAATIAERKGDVRAALSYYMAATRLAPTEASYWRALGYFQLIQRATADAIVSLKRSVEIDANATGLFYLAWAYSEAGRNDEALEAAQKSLRLEPNDPRSYRLVSGVLFTAGKYNEALVAAEHVVRLEPKSGEAIASVANLYIITERYGDALVKAQEAQKLAPKDPFVQAVLGEALLYAARPEEALAAHQAAMTLRPDYSEQQIWIALANLQLGRSDAAHQALNSAAAFEPGTLAHYERVATWKPNDVFARALYAIVLAKTGSHDRASEQIKILSMRDETLARALRAIL